MKREIIQVPQIKTFTPLHQMNNYVPIPGMQVAGQMMSHPTIPTQQLLVQHNPLVNPLRDLSGKNRKIQDVFLNDRLQLREEENTKKGSRNTMKDKAT